MKPQELLDGARRIIGHTDHMGPDCELVKNQVGNLAIVNDEGFQVGAIDLRWGEVMCYLCDDVEDEPPTA